MTWGEFVAWVDGWNNAEYGVTAHLLRQIAYQMLTLNPYINKSDKPYSVHDYIAFPTDNVKKKELEYIDPKELARIWKV